MTNRAGLYALVIGTWLSTCTMSRVLIDVDEKTKDIETKIDRIESEMKAQHGAPGEVHRENVQGDERPEAFYEIDGKRVYLEIDGMPVEEYLQQQDSAARGNGQ